MEDKKKILLLTTGGTIASVPGGEGLEPHRSGVMERELNQLRTYYDITVRDVRKRYPQHISRIDMVEKVRNMTGEEAQSSTEKTTRDNSRNSRRSFRDPSGHPD